MSTLHACSAKVLRSFLTIFFFFAALSLVNGQTSSTSQEPLEECLYFTSVVPEMKVITKDGQLYYRTDIGLPEQTALEIVGDVLYVGSGSASKINMYDMNDNLNLLGTLIEYPEQFYLEAMIFAPERNSMLVAADDFPYILEVEMDLTERALPAISSEYMMRLPENKINGAVWNFGLLKDPENNSVLIIPSQSNIIFSKNLSDNSTLRQIYSRAEEEKGPLRFSKVLESPDRSEIWVAQGRQPPGEDVGIFAMDWNGTQSSVRPILYVDSYGGFMDVVRDSEGYFYVTSYKESGIGKFAPNGTSLGLIYSDPDGSTWNLRLGPCPIFDPIPEDDSSSDPTVIIIATLVSAMVCLILIILLLIAGIALVFFFRPARILEAQPLLLAEPWKTETIEADEDVEAKDGGKAFRNERSLGALASELNIVVDPEEGFGKFGLSKKQECPVRNAIKTEFTILNKGKKIVHYSFFVPVDDSKFDLKVYPGFGELKPGKPVVITSEFTLKMTTHVERFVKLEISKPNSKKFGKKEYFLPITLDGELSTYLDPDEIEMILPAIGRGGFGTVYRGRYRGSDVAVKVINRQNQKSSIEEFEKEVDLMTRLRSPHVLHFIGASHVPGKICLVTEFCKYGSASDLLNSRKTLKYATVLNLAKDMAMAIDFLHTNGVLHRDIKPDNFMITSLSTRAQSLVKIADFGTSKSSLTPMEVFGHTQGWGTPLYMAPELLGTEKVPYSAKVDVYSFAITMWVIWYRTEPYTEFTHAWDIPRHVLTGGRPDLTENAPPEGYVDIMKDCWAQDPEARPLMSDVIPRLKDLMKNSSKEELAHACPPPENAVETGMLTEQGRASLSTSQGALTALKTSKGGTEEGGVNEHMNGFHGNFASGKGKEPADDEDPEDESSEGD